MSIRHIPVVERIFGANEGVAVEVRALCRQHPVALVNIMASPGAGKTTLLLATAHRLADRLRIGVIEGDADPHVLIPRLIEMWRAGDFPFESLVETFPLEHHAAAVEALRSGSVVKPGVLTGP